MFLFVTNNTVMLGNRRIGFWGACSPVHRVKNVDKIINGMSAVFQFFFTSYQTMGQFHQDFTSCISKRRSQKCKNTDDLTVYFVLLRSALIKVGRKHVGEIHPTSTWLTCLSFIRWLCTLQMILRQILNI